ncbi:MAG: DUF86 domain-containing protein [Nitrospirae bacterium]|nr:DUF86 domain-containing protein [Nitrospirota bacterium]
MINREFIENKLYLLRGYYNELEEILKHRDKKIKSDVILLRALERILQLIVDEMLDINKHIIKYTNLEVPEDFQGSFYVLGKSGILEEDFAMKIAPVVGLRNRIVHRYEKVNIDKLIGEVRRGRNDFKTYVKMIMDYMDKLK